MLQSDFGRVVVVHGVFLFVFNGGPGPTRFEAADAQFLHVPLPFLPQDKSSIFALNDRVAFGDVGHPPVFTRRQQRTVLEERVAIFGVVLQISVGRLETLCFVFGSAATARLVHLERAQVVHAALRQADTVQQELGLRGRGFRTRSVDSIVDSRNGTRRTRTRRQQLLPVVQPDDRQAFFAFFG